MGPLDTEHLRLSVQQALVSIAYDVQLSAMKTDKGRRTLDLDEGTVAVMEQWRRVRTTERDGRRPADTDLVFTKPDGAWVHPDIFSQIFDGKVEKLDVPIISLHDLRHTHATIMLKAGVPVKVVSERLGHANAAFPRLPARAPGHAGRGRGGVRSIGDWSRVPRPNMSQSGSTSAVGTGLCGTGGRFARGYGSQLTRCRARSTRSSTWCDDGAAPAGRGRVSCTSISHADESLGVSRTPSVLCGVVDLG